MSIKWNKRAIQQFDAAIKYIEAESPANAEKVKKNILQRIGDLPKNPERYHPDKYKTNNDGSFRAFEIYHYRIAYRFKANEIRIVRIRHVKMNPLSY